MDLSIWASTSFPIVSPRHYFNSLKGLQVWLQLSFQLLSDMSLSGLKQYPLIPLLSDQGWMIHLFLTKILSLIYAKEKMNIFIFNYRFNQGMLIKYLHTALPDQHCPRTSFCHNQCSVHHPRNNKQVQSFRPVCQAQVYNIY